MTWLLSLIFLINLYLFPEYGKTVSRRTAYGERGS
jgi:hypothetical protein